MSATTSFFPSNLAQKNSYIATNWYWVVEGMSQVWSSAALDYVDPNNRTYLNWRTSGNYPTNINPSDLVQVMQAQVQPIIMARGVTLAAPDNLAAAYPLTADALNKISNQASAIAAGRSLPGGGTVTLQDSLGRMREFTPEQFVAFAGACEQFVHDWQQALSSIILGQGGRFPNPQLTLS